MFCIKCGSKCEEFDDKGVRRFRCNTCGFINYKNPYPCISLLIINKQGEVALGKRCKDSISSDKWCLPCGYIEYGESYVEAGIRETKEEIGIDIIPKGIINVVSNQLAEISSLVVVLFALYEGQASLVPGDDIDDAGWFSIYQSLPTMAFSADEFIIKKYRDSIKSLKEINTITLEGNFFKAM